MPSIQAGPIKSRFLLMPARARDTIWFTTSADAHLSARAVTTFGGIEAFSRIVPPCPLAKRAALSGFGGFLHQLRKIPFITPMAPTLTKEPPTGDGWLHEIKFAASALRSTTIYSRNGNDLTRRFRRLKSTIASIRVDSAIIDCKLVDCDESGRPDFRALMSNKRDCDLCLWCFDLLALDGERLTEKPLAKRRALLNEVVNFADDHAVQFSMAFDEDANFTRGCRAHESGRHRLEA